MSPEPPKPEPSPSRALGGRQIGFGAAIAAFGGASFALGSWPVGVPLLAFGGLIAGLGAVVRVSGDAVPVVNTSYNLLLQGKVDEAERILDQAEGRWQLGYVRRVIDLQRAAIAMRRGDFEGALVRVEAALRRPPSLLTRGQEHAHLVGAQALRALIRASLGDVEGARADAAAVRALPDAPPEALARAEVAEAVALERSGNREALAAHLTAHRRLLLDATVPRERAVVRAYQRMLLAPRTTIYRRSASRDAPGAEPSAADWVSRVSPAAAPFARARSEAPSLRENETVDPPPLSGLVRVAEDRVRGRASGAAKRRVGVYARLALLWVVLIVAFLGFWQIEPLFAVPGGAGDAVRAILPDAFGLVLTVTVFAMLAVMIGRNLRHDRRVAVALGALARGQAGAKGEIEALARSPHAGAAVQAELALARLAERRGDFAEALQHCDRGLAAATARESTRALLSSILLPDLVAERAFLLAVMDREEKARAEMATLAQSFPAYPFKARAELRVNLAMRARRGDVEGAAAALSGVTDDLPLSQRDETLADLVRAVASPDAVGAAEGSRLREELRIDPDLRAWLGAVAPPVLRAFEAAAEPERAVTAVGDDEAEAEREAEAELEAAQGEEGEEARRRA